MILPGELKAAREAAGITQLKLAHLSGVSLTTISMIESSGADPRTSTMVKLSEVIESIGKASRKKRNSRSDS